jgi:hypothetical protein
MFYRLRDATASDRKQKLRGEVDAPALDLSVRETRVTAGGR